MISRLNFETAKEALKTGDVSQLEILLEKEGFVDRIDPMKLSKSRWYLDNLRLRQKADEPEIVVALPSGSKIYKDRTDYLTPYSNGFVRTNENGLIAGYGIIDKIFVFEEKEIEPPQHFFFITQQDGELADLLIGMAAKSPGNPASKECIRYPPSRYGLPFATGLFALELAVLMLSARYGFNPLEGLTEDQQFLAGGIVAAINCIVGYYIGKWVLGPKYSGTYAKSSLIRADYGIKGLKRYFESKENDR